MPPARVDPVPWILETKEPSLTWRVLTELEGRAATDPEVVAARLRIGTEGWAAAILKEQLADGQWDSPGTDARALYRPKYIATNWRLLVLSDLGLDRTNAGVERAAELMFAAHARPDGDLGGTGSEVCFTGNAVRMLSKFGYGDDPRLRAAIDWLVATQKPDGGWHCDPAGAGTIDCWEALAGFDALPKSQRTPAVERAVERGAEFYLGRGLLSEGTEEYAPWHRLHYPVHYYYDFLVGLDSLTRLGYGHDTRLGPALDLLEQLRNPDGTWNMGPAHPDLPRTEVDYRPEPPLYPFVLEWPGRPSRWLTITALAVLRRAGRAPA
jgi:hypothetical protein